jgi:hypothetical protein
MTEGVAKQMILELISASMVVESIFAGRQIEVRAKQVDGAILEGCAQDIARKVSGWHGANVVGAKIGGKGICLSALIHIPGFLGKLNVKFNVQNSDSKWVHSYKTQKSRFIWMHTKQMCCFRKAVVGPLMIGNRMAKTLAVVVLFTCAPPSL